MVSNVSVASIKMTKVSGKFGGLIATFVAVSIPTIGNADEIALTLTNHGFTIEGEFTEFVDTYYVIMTENGSIMVPADMVSCAGDDCVDTLAAATVDS